MRPERSHCTSALPRSPVGATLSSDFLRLRLQRGHRYSAKTRMGNLSSRAIGGKVEIQGSGEG
jgi:hypothetical protein